MDYIYSLFLYRSQLFGLHFDFQSFFFLVLVRRIDFEISVEFHNDALRKSVNNFIYF